jgi:LacI family transcriptional regulator
LPYTLEGVAKLAGVSRSTVSRVVNDHPSVRAEVREQVWRVIHETGYQPYAAARSLVTRRTHILGVVIPEPITKLFADPFFPILLYGITETCNAQHYYLMLSLFHGPAEQDDQYRRIVGNGHLDGVIIASTHMDDSLPPRLLQDDVPFAVVGRYPDARVHGIDVDNIGGSRQAVEHLIRLGHTAIALISGPLTMTSGADRLAGYQQALAARGIALDQDLIVEGDYTEDSGYAAVKRLLRTPATAIFAASDIMAIGALKALHEAGRQVPQDMALVGFDDVPLASSVQPALTTVRQPIRQLGSAVAALLLELLAHPPERCAPAHTSVLPTELVVRRSCGAAGVMPDPPP